MKKRFYARLVVDRYQKIPNNFPEITQRELSKALALEMNKENALSFRRTIEELSGNYCYEVFAEVEMPEREESTNLRDAIFQQRYGERKEKFQDVTFSICQDRQNARNFMRRYF